MIFRKSIRKLPFLLATGLLLSVVARADGPPALPSTSNPFVVIMIVMILILALAIGLLANIVLGAARIPLAKDTGSGTPGTPQDSESGMVKSGVALAVPSLINGVSDPAVYLMTGVAFLEVVVLFILLYNVKLLLSVHKEREVAVKEAAKPSSLMSWKRYALYCSVIFACFYLWQSHGSHSAQPGRKEDLIAVRKAETDSAENAKTAVAIDENSVKLLTGRTDLSAGQAIFETTCFACHGKSGEGIVGPNLTDENWIHGGSIQDIFKTVKFGWPDKGMKSWKDDYSALQIAEVASYVKSLGGTHPANPKPPEGALYK